MRGSVTVPGRGVLYPARHPSLQGRLVYLQDIRNRPVHRPVPQGLSTAAGGLATTVLAARARRHANGAPTGGDEPGQVRAGDAAGGCRLGNDSALPASGTGRPGQRQAVNRRGSDQHRRGCAQGPALEPRGATDDLEKPVRGQELEG